MKPILLVAAVAVSQCLSPLPQPEPAPQPEPPSGEFTCADICAHYTRMGCEESTSTPEGASCEDVCAAAQAGPAPLDLGCVMRAPDCQLARRCE